MIVIFIFKMPKVKNESAKLQQFVVEFSSYVFKTDGKVLSDSIKKAKELFDNQNLKNDLAYIKSNFCFISQVIINLQNKHLTLHESL